MLSSVQKGVLFLILVMLTLAPTQSLFAAGSVDIAPAQPPIDARVVDPTPYPPGDPDPTNVPSTTPCGSYEKILKALEKTIKDLEKDIKDLEKDIEKTAKSSGWKSKLKLGRMKLKLGSMKWNLESFYTSRTVLKEELKECRDAAKNATKSPQAGASNY